MTESVGFPMTWDDFMRRMLTAFPDAEVDADNDGQLVVYTNWTENSSGFVTPMEAGPNG